MPKYHAEHGKAHHTCRRPAGPGVGAREHADESDRTEDRSYRELGQEHRVRQ